MASWEILTVNICSLNAQLCVQLIVILLFKGQNRETSGCCDKAEVLVLLQRERKCPGTDLIDGPDSLTLSPAPIATTTEVSVSGQGLPEPMKPGEV